MNTFQEVPASEHLMLPYQEFHRIFSNYFQQHLRLAPQMIYQHHSERINHFK